MTRHEKKVRIFSALEVANICGVVNQTAINWIKNHHLKAFTTPGGQYRIYAEDLLDFLKDRGMRVPDDLYEYDHKKSIIIVDDDVDLNNMLKEIINKRLPEFEIIQAFDGFEAGSLISSENPHVIILDIDLPGINGHKLCAKIKEDDTLRSPVIISISGLDEPVEAEKILSEGADAFFGKPINMEKLIETIKDLVAIRR